MGLITVIRTPGPCVKSYREGSKPKQAQFYASAVGTTIEIKGVDQFSETLSKVQSKHDLQIVLSAPKGAKEGETFNILSAESIAKALNAPKYDAPKGFVEIKGERCIRRSKEGWVSGGIALFDFDLVRGMPQQLIPKKSEDWLSSLGRLIPTFDGAGMVVTPSNSSRVLHLDGSQAVSSSNAHAYVLIRNAEDLESFGQRLLIKALATEHSEGQTYGFSRPILRKGTDEIVGYRPWANFDPTTFSRERVCYEGAPLTEGGLMLAEPRITVIEGHKLDTRALQVTEEMVEKVNMHSGLSLEVKRSEGEKISSSKLIDKRSLTLSTELDTAVGVMTLREYWLNGHRKLRCQAPFRLDSSSMAAFIDRHSDGVPFVYDVGLQLKYILPEPRIDEMNLKYAFMTLQGKTRMMIEKRDSEGRPIQEFLTRSDFNALMANKPPAFVWNEKKEEWVPLSIAKYWIEHANRREYEGITFYPSNNGEVNGYYNLWRGFALEPQQGDCDLILEHLKEVVCAGDEKHYEYTLSWFAHLIQKPAEKVGVAFVLRGEKGTGKGVLARLMHRLLGHHCKQVFSSKHLVGSFNAHMADCLLVVADEAFWAGDKASEGALKGLITEPFTMLERKGIDAQQIRSYTRVMKFTNEEWVIPASGGERRFFVMDISPERKGDSNYFNELFAQIDGTGAASFLHYLIGYEQPGWVDLRNPPHTTALNDQKLNSLDIKDEWWLECLQDERIMGKGSLGVVHVISEFHNECDWWDKVDSVPVSDVVESLKSFASSRRANYRINSQSVGRFLSEVCGPDLQTHRPRRNGSQVRCYCFPPLDLMRERFEKRLNMVIGW